MRSLLLELIRLIQLTAIISARPIRATLSPELNKVETSMDRYKSDGLICNQDGCYPELFQADKEWKTVKEGQILPGGLDIRMNLDTGLKEAKLEDETKGGNSGSIVPISASPDNEVQYEFTGDFQLVDKLLHNLHSAQDVEKLENKLEDLMVFAHDYKHGSKIIRHEFDLLRGIALKEQLPASIRELGIRMIVSCLRNNAKSIEYVQKIHPEFTHQVFHELSKTSTGTRVLIKRYLSVLDVLLPSAYPFTRDEVSILEKTYKIQDSQIRIKILELISKYFGSVEELNLNKKDILKTTPDVNEWAQELQKWIQNENIDELHIRKFFNSLYNIKTKLNSEIKIDPTFADWLSYEMKKRKANFADKNERRDLEQDSFDQRLIESRHLVFGNPMAHRIKHFNDEF